MYEKDELKKLLNVEEDQALAKELGVSKGAVCNWSTQGVPKYVKLLLKYAGSSSATIDIPVYALAGAGNPRLSSGEVIISIVLPIDFTKPGITPVLVKGDSMKPVILDGAIVGVDENDRSYVPGKYYAIWSDDEGALIKKISNAGDKIYVESLNKDEHSFYLDKEVVRDHFIIGRVRWWINQDTGK